MGSTLQNWGVVVGHGETVKCNPGEFGFHISQIALQDGKGNEDARIFVKVDNKEILLGTLSDDKYPHFTTDLIFDKEFELLHTSKTRNISITGYKYRKIETKSGSSTEADDESNEEVPLAIPLFPIADDDKGKNTESGSGKDPRKLQTNTSGADDDDESYEDYVELEEGESNDDEDSSDDDNESSDEDDGENFPKHAKDKNRLAETPLKTPPVKKAKMTPPSKGNDTSSSTGTRRGYVHVATPYPSKRELVKKRPSFRQENAPSTGDDDSKSSDEDDGENIPKHAKDKNRLAETPLKTPPGKKAKMTPPSKGNNTGSSTGTRRSYVHVATPYPELVKNRPSFRQENTPSTGDSPEQTAGYACESCSRTFNSYIALKTHCKVKKHKRGAYK